MNAWAKAKCVLCFHGKNNFCKANKASRQKAAVQVTQHIKSTYHVPGKVLDSRDEKMSKTQMTLVFKELVVSGGEGHIIAYCMVKSNSTVAKRHAAMWLVFEGENHHISCLEKENLIEVVCFNFHMPFIDLQCLIFLYSLYKRIEYGQSMFQKKDN